jgi:superfamily I DNA and/or RNA helicase
LQIIIASIRISDKGQLKAEEEFIYDLNRFNVLTSRAKSKAILVCSENFLDYLPKRHQIMESVEKIRKFTYDFCNNSKSINISNETVVFHWKE